jgi:exodeoxyribonuclease VII large subunit
VDERTYGVAELGSLIARIVHQSFPGRCWVRGQIRNLTRPAAGHVYFDLAEPGPLGESPDAVIPVTLLASDRPTVNAVMKAAGAGRMVDGMEIRLAGRLAWFSPRGRLQLRMSTIDPAYTLGRLGEDRDRLLAALRAEQLLDRNRSVPMPVLPLRIGLVTSLGSAAHADFRHELERSGIGFRVFEADARTQGLDAGRSIAVAIARLVGHGVDVVAVVRGGGSRTDLAPFDGEVIARAIALAAIPVVTGIGHEVDRSIADEVAHRSFKTPTACAAGLIEIAAAAIDRSEVLWAAISSAATARLVAADDRVRSGAHRLERSSAGGLAAGERTLLEAARRLTRESTRALALAGQRLDGAEARRRSFDPALALARGWSVTRDGAGRVVRSVQDAPAGTRLVTTVADGDLRSTVDDG